MNTAIKKFGLGSAACVCLYVIWLFLPFASADGQTLSTEKEIQTESLLVGNVVISQVYGGGGASGAPYTNDYVEIFNRGNTPVSLNGWSTQYASSSGSNWLVTPLSNVTLNPGQYYLIQYASNGSTGSALPTPDLIAPPVTSNGSTFIPNLSATTGKVALVNSVTPLPGVPCPSDVSMIDLIGYGTASCQEGTATAPALSITTAAFRASNGCQDTDQNSADFSAGAPAPRNTSSPTNNCGTVGTGISAVGQANPSTIEPGASTVLTVRVAPASMPTSTGIAVVCNLSSISGAASQTFFDDGTNGDQTAGDNIFTYTATVPTTIATGSKLLACSVTDAQSRAANTTISLTVQDPSTFDDHLLLGNPSNATTDVVNENNYLMVKPQYILSYNRSRAIPNWTAWRLDSSWIGSTPRQDDFRPDTTLPSGWYQVIPQDYSGSGYDRGHMTPSGDRTRSVADNSATFLMTNMIPQLPANNQGPWEDFESYCRSLVSAGNEIYIYAGGTGTAGTIAGGRVTVPAATWKIAVVLPNGTNDLQRINKSTRVIAISIPNQGTVNINSTWRQYRTTVNEIEAQTGFNFFTKVNPNLRRIFKFRRDSR